MAFLPFDRPMQKLFKSIYNNACLEAVKIEILE